MWMVCLLVLVAAVAAYRILPADLRALVAENCRDAQGRLRVRYTLREWGSIAHFYGGMALMGCFVAGAFLLPLAWVHDHWIPIDIATDALSRIHPNPVVWRERLAAAPEDLIQRHRQWFVQQGGTKEQAQQIQSLLWSAIPLSLLLGMIAAAISGRWLLKGFRTGVEQLAEVVYGRRTARLTACYLQDAEQRRHRHRNPAEHAAEHSELPSSAGRLP